jgi:hypothetical protein
MTNNAFKIGSAVREITPAFPAWLDGYAARTRPSDAVSQPISIGCLSVSDGEKTVLIFTCDLLGIEAHNCATLYQEISTSTGINYPDILISCSHTHFAPNINTIVLYSPELGLIPPDERFVADFHRKLLEVAQESLRNQQPVELETVRVNVPSVLFNRRTITRQKNVVTNFRYPKNADDFEFSPTDTELTVLRFVNERGVQAVLANFGCHPVTGEDNMYAVSADYPFYFRKYLSEAYHCPVFFTLGAAGDAVPRRRGGNSRQLIGSILANSVQLAESMFTRDVPDLQSGFFTVPVKTIVATDAKKTATEFVATRQAFLPLFQNQANYPEEAFRAGQQTFIDALIRSHRVLLYPENQFEIKIQTLKIGSSLFAAFPFEVLSEISLKLKAEIPGFVLSSCSGGYQGYLPLAYEYARGGYEATENSTHFEIGVADRLLAEMRRRFVAANVSS